MQGAKDDIAGNVGLSIARRYYLGVDVGYKEHVAGVISLETFARGDERWKHARCVHFPSTQAGLRQLQRYLERFSNDPTEFLGLCEPTGGHYGATVFQYLLDQGYAMHLVENATVKHMREKVFPGLPKTDEMDARVMARIGYLHEAVGEEFTLRSLELPDPDSAHLLVLCRDSWRLNTMLTRARNQFTQLMAVTFPELKTFFTSSVSTVVPVSLIAAYQTPALLAEASPAKVQEVLWKAGDYQHAQRVAELQALARDSSGLLPDILECQPLCRQPRLPVADGRRGQHHAPHDALGDDLCGVRKDVRPALQCQPFAAAGIEQADDTALSLLPLRWGQIRGDLLHDTSSPPRARVASRPFGPDRPAISRAGCVNVFCVSDLLKVYAV